MSTATASMKECIENCQECQTTCADTLTSHCLSEGGDHVGHTHVKLMRDCIAACAEICKACADSCEKVGNMDKCVECCRNCQQSCSAMAS